MLDSSIRFPKALGAIILAQSHWQVVQLWQEQFNSIGHDEKKSQNEIHSNYFNQECDFWEHFGVGIALILTMRLFKEARWAFTAGCFLNLLSKFMIIFFLDPVPQNNSFAMLNMIAFLGGQSTLLIVASQL